MNWEARSQRPGVWDACGSIPLAATRGQPWTLIGTSVQAVLRIPVARRGHLSGMLGEARRQWQLGPGSWLWGSWFAFAGSSSRGEASGEPGQCKAREVDCCWVALTSLGTSLGVSQEPEREPTQLLPLEWAKGHFLRG